MDFLIALIDIAVVIVAAVVGYYFSNQREDRLTKDLDNYEKWLAFFQDNDSEITRLVEIESYDSITKALYLKTDYRSKSKYRASIILFSLSIAMLILSFITIISQGQEGATSALIDLGVFLVFLIVSIILFQTAAHQNTEFAKRFTKSMDDYRSTVGLPYLTSQAKSDNIAPIESKQYPIDDRDLN